MDCIVCGSQDTKTWVYGHTCDLHDAPISQAFMAWRAANPEEPANMFRVSTDLDAAAAKLREAD
jgi:hypothetical protein